MSAETPTPSISRRIWRRRLMRFALEGVLVVAALAGLLIGFAAWRLKTGPLDVAFAKDYIESVLRNPDRGTYAKMDRVFLQWPDLTGPLQLGLQGVRIMDKDSKVIVAVDEAAINLSRARLLIGQVAPVSLILKGPALRVIRTADGAFDVGFSRPQDLTSPEVVEQAEAQTSLVQRILDYIGRPGDQATEHTPLATLRAFEIQNARVMVEDHIIGVTWFLPRLDAAFHSTEEGLEADLYAELPGGREAQSFAAARLLVDWNDKTVAVAAQVKNFDARTLAGKIPALADLYDQDLVIDAQLEATLDSSFRPAEGRLQVSSAGGSIQIPDVYDAPLAFQNLGLQASYDGIKHTLEVQKFSVDLNGIPLRASAALTQDGDRIAGPVTLAIETLPQKDIERLWPASLRGDASEEWIVKKMSGGTFHDLTAGAQLELHKAAEGWSFDVDAAKAAFAFDGMDVDYRAPMIPVTQASGRGSFDYGTELLSVDIDSAMIGELAVREAHLEFADIIKVGAGKADISVKLQGPLKSGIAYVMREPIAMKPPFDAEKVQGTLDAAIEVRFPTHHDIKVSEVKVGVDGTMTDVLLPGAVKSLDVSGGPMKITVKDDSLNVKGRGELSGRAMNFDYREFMEHQGKPYKFQVTAALGADKALRDYLGAGLDDFIDGTVPVNVSYTAYEGGKAEADITADLKPVRVMVDPFDYEKPVGEEGAAALKLILQDDKAIAVKGLTATAPKLKLESSNLAFRQQGAETILSQGKLSRFVIGETVGTLNFEVTPSGQMKVVLEAPFFDLRPFLDNEQEQQVYDDPPMLISVAADTMRTADHETVQYGKIYADIDQAGQFNQLELDAIAGSGNVYFRFKPDSTGKRVLRFEADDAGATLKAFGLYDKIRGGTMTAYGQPIKGVFDRNLVGNVEINNFRVVKAPGLAKLLSAMSLTGLLDVLGSNDGMAFTKLEAKFDYFYRARGSTLILKDGTTSGNSLGLTFDGTFDNAKGTVDVSGTMIPLSGVNKVIGDIPLIGDILTGGSGGVFAATYSVKGKTEKPEISVNPLSILTPGILRRILFEKN